jgi:putative transposase
VIHGLAESGEVGIIVLCRLVGMSRQNYYYQRSVRVRLAVEEALVLALVRVERGRQARLGGRKLWCPIHGELEVAGVSLGRDRFFALLRRHALLIVRRRNGCRTTFSHHGFQVYVNLAKDLLLTGIHQLWVCDITYLRTEEGFMYLALHVSAYRRGVHVSGVGDGRF